MALSYSKTTIGIIKRITSKHHGDFYCLNYLYSFATEKKRVPYKKVCEIFQRLTEFCNILMPSEETKI